MNELESWITSHWVEILTYLGIGGGSGILGKKLTDKKQDEKIKRNEEELNKQRVEIVRQKELNIKNREQILELSKRQNNITMQMLRIDKKLDVNTEADKQFRASLNRQMDNFNNGMNDIKNGQAALLSQFMDLLKQNR